MDESSNDIDQYDSIADKKRQEVELSFLFGKDIVEQARLIDVVDLNLSDAMTRSISEGVTRLKKIRDQPENQLKLINNMTPGERLVVCMWIMDMNLLDKLQSRSYLQS
ncbi:MAG: hypothetical protein ACKVHQ_00260 [Gammaproteobacteria bacterium]|jgi:hypothetical protein